MLLIVCAIPDIVAFLVGAVSMGCLGFVAALLWLLACGCEGVSLVNFTFNSFMDSGSACLVCIHTMLEICIGVPINLLFMGFAHLVATRQQRKYFSKIF
jgi:hypothetical protein